MVGIEHIDELVQMSIKNVQADDPELLTSGRIKLLSESGCVKVMPLSKFDYFEKIIRVIPASVHSGRRTARLPGGSAV